MIGEKEKRHEGKGRNRHGNLDIIIQSLTAGHAQSMSAAYGGEGSSCVPGHTHHIASE